VRQRFAQRPELDRLAARIEAARQDKCAIVGSFAGPHSIPGTTGAAVPVFIGDHIAATIGIIGSTESMPKTADSPVIGYLKEAAEQLSRQLRA